MESGGRRGVRVLGALLVLAAVVGPGVESVSANPRAPEQASRSESALTVPTATPTPVAAAPSEGPRVAPVVAAEVPFAARAHAAPPVTPQRRLRRVRQAELNDALVRASAALIRKHHAEKVGTEIELQVAGKAYVARIERHHHPEGGELKPWGYHPGVSLFTVR